MYHRGAPKSISNHAPGRASRRHDSKKMQFSPSGMLRSYTREISAQAPVKRDVKKNAFSPLKFVKSVQRKNGKYPAAGSDATLTRERTGAGPARNGRSMCAGRGTEKTLKRLKTGRVWCRIKPTAKISASFILLICARISAAGKSGGFTK